MSNIHYPRPEISLIEKSVDPFGVSMFIGGSVGASNLELLKKNDITTVVNCAVNCDFNIVPEIEGNTDTGHVTSGHGAYRYYKIGMVDGHGNPATMMLAAYYLLRSAMLQELPDRPTYPHRTHGNILVNCRGGRSRSVSLVSLFLHKNMPDTYPTIDAAIEHVRIARKLHPDEWDSAPKTVMIDAVRQASSWIDLIGHDMPARN